MDFGCGEMEDPTTTIGYLIFYNWWLKFDSYKSIALIRSYIV